MNSPGMLDMLKLAFKLIAFKFEQQKLATSIYTVVNTTNGAVKGIKRLSVWGDAYYSFEGIPYAKPPLGDLRFRAPVPAEPWNTVLNCTKPAAKPLQASMLFRKCQGSEDCLYLNVFTKNLTPEKPLPVMVWIYGGAFQLGEATRDLYSPDYFMSKDVVLVTIAYRLGPFGFLSMDDPEVNIPGNAGIKDQILSLKWVQENIAAFGGDANNVTLFGVSAGAGSTHICMLSEQTRGLIHKGIVMSGSALCPWACLPRNNWAYRLAKSLGFEGAQKDSEVYEFLRNVKGPDIINGLGKVLNKNEKHHRILFAFGPVVEPYVTDECVFAEQPYDLLKKTWSNQIPMMIGGTSFEGLLFYPEITGRYATLDEVKNCKNLLPNDLGLNADSKETEEYGLQLKRSYFGEEECNRENMMKFLELESYRSFWHPIYRTAYARLKHNAAATYVYRFDFDSKTGNYVRNLLCGHEIRGACHGDDLGYIFYNLFAHHYAKNTPERRVICLMVDTLYSFAAKGDPNCDILQNVEFKPLKKDEPMKCLNIKEKFEFIDLPELEKLQVWSSFYKEDQL